MRKRSTAKEIADLASSYLNEKELGWEHAVFFISQWTEVVGKSNKQRNLNTRRLVIALNKKRHRPLSDEGLRVQVAGIELAERLLARARTELSRR